MILTNVSRLPSFVAGVEEVAITYNHAAAQVVDHFPLTSWFTSWITHIWCALIRVSNPITWSILSMASRSY